MRTPARYGRNGLFFLTVACCLVAKVSAAATDSSAPVDLLSATREQVLNYLLEHLPACQEFEGTRATVSIRYDRVVLYYPSLNYGTTDTFPLTQPFTAEAHSSNDNWRLFVRFRHDAVTTDVPYIHGHGSSSVFSCDGDAATVQALALAFTRLQRLREQRRTARDARPVGG
jgi:hypothetical protein